MEKYKIVKKQHCDTWWYAIKKKKWHGWTFIEKFGNGDIYLGHFGSDGIPKLFKTEQEAQDVINNLLYENSIDDGTEKDKSKSFKLGKETGIKEGILKGMAANFERSEEVPEQEYKEVMEFLVNRGLELCCYDINRGGFRIRKKIHHIENKKNTLNKIDLEILRPNHAGAFVRKDSGINTPAINYGCIRIENETLVYWTNKALLYMFSSQEKTTELKSKSENELIKEGHIETIRLEDIYRVLF